MKQVQIWTIRERGTSITEQLVLPGSYLPSCAYVPQRADSKLTFVVPRVMMGNPYVQSDGEFRHHLTNYVQ
jgi:hypothetical protein